MAGISGKPGPLAKRDEDRVRRNKTGEDGVETKEFVLEGEVKPPAGVRFGEPTVQALWDALKKSVNRQFYEPTDWAYAVIVLGMWDAVLAKGGIPGAMLLTALDGMMSRLLVTEADRRRLKIEAKRAPVEKQATHKASDFYQRMFEEQRQERVLQAVPNQDAG
jgi:hypothetical protein